MLFRKSFQTKIESANRVFTATIEKLKNIQTDMNAQIEQNKNQAKMQKLANDNTELEAMKLKAARQIEEISKFIA